MSNSEWILRVKTGLRFGCVLSFVGFLLSSTALAGSTHVGKDGDHTHTNGGSQDTDTSFYQKLVTEFHDHPHIAGQQFPWIALSIHNHHFNEEMVHDLQNHPYFFFDKHHLFGRFLHGQQVEIRRNNSLHPNTGSHSQNQWPKGAPDFNYGNGNTSGAPLPENQTVPEPTSCFLLTAGMLVLGVARRYQLS